MAFEVFISYSHKDREWYDKLAAHLSPLKSQGRIAPWFDGDIIPGTDWKKDILQHLDSAQIVLLLISADFMKSEFCTSIELERAIERHDANQARVIPIITRPVYWQRASFAKLEVLPQEGKPVSSWSSPDDAYENVVRGILRAIDDLQAKKASQSATDTTPVGAEQVSQWLVPFEQNPYFTGREKVLSQIHDDFLAQSNKKSYHPQVISGLGGIGKTQLAIEYAYRYRDEYQYVFWTRAAIQDVLIADFANLASVLDLPTKDSPDQTLSATSVKRWLQLNTGWLLILDNVDDLAAVQQFLPLNVQGHILLTSRTPAVGAEGRRVELDGLTKQESVLYLLRRSQTVPLDAAWEDIDGAVRAKAAEIAETMGYLPLALTQAAAYIEKTRCGLAGYLERYQKRWTRLLQEKGGLGAEHPEPIATTWSLSFERVEQSNPAAADLLRFCAFLHPDAIPEELIIASASTVSPALQAIADDPFEFDDAVVELMRYSLIRRNADEKTLTVHRLVQTVLKDGMDEQTQRTWVEQTVWAVNKAFPAVSVQTWQQCQPILPHAQVCAALIKQWKVESAEALRLLEVSGQYLHDRGQYKDAEPLLQQLLEIQEQLYGKEHLDIARTLNLLGELARRQGHYHEAQSLYERALALREQMLEQDHADVATSLNNLARPHHHFAHYSQAEEFYQRALAIRERVLGHQHQDVADSLHDLAVLYSEQGKYEEAFLLSQRALTIREQVLGSQHPDTAISLHNLANLYRVQGKYQDALPLLRRAFAIHERVLGAQHPNTVTSLHGLVGLYQEQGKYEEAFLLSQRALTIREQVLGSQHPDTAISLSSLGSLYKEQGKYEEALPLFERALAIREQVLGPQHPDTAAGLNNLASLYQEQGKYQEALPLLQRALAIHEQVLGSQHTDTATSLDNLAGLYQAQGRILEAIRLSKRALAIREKVLGTKHPDVAVNLNTLGVIYGNQRNFKEAEPLFQRALGICKQTLGLEHPSTLKILVNYAVMLRMAKRNSKAKELEGQIEEIRIKLRQEGVQEEKGS